MRDEPITSQIKVVLHEYIDLSALNDEDNYDLRTLIAEATTWAVFIDGQYVNPHPRKDWVITARQNTVQDSLQVPRAKFTRYVVEFTDPVNLSHRTLFIAKDGGAVIHHVAGQDA